jgi:alkylation response protein AidB-like acyl-CoA dehydrogenase
MPSHSHRDDEERTRDAWAQLGQLNKIRQLFASPDSRYGYDPVRLRDLLAATRPPLSALSLGSLLGICVQAATAIPLLMTARRTGRTAQLTSVLDGVLEGRELLAVAATDIEAAGSDLASLGTTLESAGDDCVLNGGKRWIVNAATASSAIVLARHASSPAFTSFTLVLVPLDVQGVVRRPTKTGFFTGAGLGDLLFDNVRMPSANILGGRGRGLALFSRQMVGERVANGLWAERLVRSVLSGTLAHVSRHEVGRGPLWEHQTVRTAYAESVVASRALSAFAESSCAPIAATQSYGQIAGEAAAFKAAGSLTLDAVLTRCAPLFGADGFCDGGIQRLRVEAGMFGIAGGALPLLYDTIVNTDHWTGRVDDPDLAGWFGPS